MKKLFKYIFLLPALLIVPSCSEDYLDINTDPNNPTSVTPDLALPVAQHLTATYLLLNNRVNTLGNLLMYNWGQTDGYAWYPDEFKYLVTSSFYQTCFNTAYQNPLKQFQTLDRPDDPTYDNYTAISMIMKSYIFQILVDMYGDIPYSEALQRSKLAAPKYDDAQTIYEDLIVKLDEAINLINNASESALVPDIDDAMFGGDMDEWIKFANSVKLRILVRQSDMEGRAGYIQEQMNVIIAEGSGFITADVGINPGYRKEVDKQSPLWDSYAQDANGSDVMNGKATCATPFVIDLLTNTNDPRIDRIYEKPANGHLGVPQGLLDYDTPVKDAYEVDKVSNLGPGVLKSYDQDAVIFHLSDSYLLQAEAVLKGFMTGDAKSLFNKGITASFKHLGLTEAQAATYVNQVLPLVNWDITPAGDRLEAIITQRYIALNSLDAIQSWFDYNRTGFPSDLPISLLAVGVHDDRPVRLMYPSSERSSNPDNVPAQPDPFTVKIFWAQ
ncbi:MAG: SusD/RagB family nutrient-binding outer membrane lipoprotein [Bacteroidales bacterium]|nr:SusD/RagB family nutrient-binding outer membrane lipoprotein [Bacteroidales bacterium]